MFEFAVLWLCCNICVCLPSWLSLAIVEQASVQRQLQAVDVFQMPSALELDNVVVAIHQIGTSRDPKQMHVDWTLFVLGTHHDFLNRVQECRYCETQYDTFDTGHSNWDGRVKSTNPNRVSFNFSTISNIFKIKYQNLPGLAWESNRTVPFVSVVLNFQS